MKKKRRQIGLVVLPPKKYVALRYVWGSGRKIMFRSIYLN